MTCDEALPLLPSLSAQTPAGAQTPAAPAAWADDYTNGGGNLSDDSMGSNGGADDRYQLDEFVVGDDDDGL